MKHFNPFEKDIDALSSPDLLKLKSVTEGWYVEYKREIPKSDSIAKSISALANSYGGWLFYGIEEESKQNSVAGRFLGIPTSEVDAALQRIRLAVANGMNPACHFEVIAIYGPCDIICLPAERAVICIAVPQSSEAPHIHNKGVIYRRIADASEPAHETDRHMIEKMFSRGKKTDESFKEWVHTPLELSDEEHSLPIVRLLITPNLWSMPRPGFLLTPKITRDILNNTENRKITLPFDNFYSSSRGIVARQCTGGNSIYSAITWTIHRDFRSEITIPLPLNKGNLNTIEGALSHYKHTNQFIKSLKKSGFTNIGVVDLNIIFNVLQGIVAAQRALLKQANWPQKFHIKVQLLNNWRNTSFLDIDSYLDHITEFGPPICLNKECIYPSGHSPNTFWEVENYQALPDEDIQTLAQTTWSFLPIAAAFGVPISMIIDDKYDPETNPTSILTKLRTAGALAQKKMNANQK
ncbi:helix-turn-helix domain-containing protein [Pseudomonas putida]|uniref:AlbA family DNA-binding domain-containing protein n=1 Tax=Pseudomonas putida TaxID=303 RepID=UPI00383B60AC